MRRQVPYFFRLQRRLFLSFGATIAATAIAVVLVVRFLSDDSWHQETARLQRLVGGEFARVWDRPEERAALAERIARELDARLEVRDARGAVLQRIGPECRWPSSAPVYRFGEPLGEVRGCTERMKPHALRMLAPLLVVALALWWTAGRLSARILRPLGTVVRLAEELGAGKLGARVETRCLRNGEERLVAESLNRMADRIERQIEDQKELLAAVSHELRTPLGHLRIITETARGGGLEAKALDQIDREIGEMDALVGDLLANSRLQFATLSVQRLDGADLARQALERAGLDADLLSVEGDTALDGDATLLGRALANLLENARRHGGGARRLNARRQGNLIVFAVEDEGPGFAPGEETKAFEALRQRSHASTHGALGLGLNLVKRIAQAHGGDAWAGNLEGKGARVAFGVRAA